MAVVSPRFLFPSTIWTLIPPLFMTSTYAFLVEVLLACSWWEFFPYLPFFDISGLSLTSFVLVLSTSAFFFFLCVAFPSTVL
jgi:hypothetical protein